MTGNTSRELGCSPPTKTNRPLRGGGEGNKMRALSAHNSKGRAARPVLEVGGTGLPPPPSGMLDRATQAV